MMNVEQGYPGIRWGREIQVEKKGDRLVVAGYPIHGFDDEDNLSGDPWESYRAAATDWRSDDAKASPPHILFANATTDEKLLDFVRCFGPITVDAMRGGRFDAYMLANQDLTELRNEQALYATSLRLLSALQADDDPSEEQLVGWIREIAEKVQWWPQQWQRELLLRKTYGTEPNWKFSKVELGNIERHRLEAERKLPDDADTFEVIAFRAFRPSLVQMAEYILCELVNAFRLKIYPWSEKQIVEAPDRDIAFGIRPVLYLILRRLCLKGGVAVCANERCRRLLEVERSGQKFCNQDCSRHQRQREYWKEKGEDHRRRRRETYLASGASLSPKGGVE